MRSARFCTAGAANFQCNVHDLHDLHDPSAKTPIGAPRERCSNSRAAPEEISASTSCRSSRSSKLQRFSPSTSPVDGPIVFVDFETQSAAKLDEVGGRRYAADATTRVLCAVARLPDGSFVEWFAGQRIPAALERAVADGVPVAAHNAFGFDSYIWRRLGWPEPDSWVDTIHQARAAGLPGALDELGHQLLAVGKDSQGADLVRRINRIDPATGALPYVDAPTHQKVLAYCRHDVELLAAVWNARLAELADVEAEIRAVDRAINDRGFAVDAELARAVMAMERRLMLEAQEAAPVSDTVLASPAKLRAWLREAGFDLPNAQRGTLEGLLDEPDLPDDVRLVVEARLLASGITGKKLRAALRRLEPDGRYRDGLAYHAAHTGRWSGRGFQPQNLARGVNRLDIDRSVALVLADDLDGLRLLAAEVGTTPLLVLSTLIRPCIIAGPGKLLGVVDYAQIEARALLWVAGDEANLAAFRSTQDPYSVEAAALFGITYEEVERNLHRPLGKIATLGSGYGMGSERFELHGEAHGIDWSAVSLSPAQVIDSWRDRHPLVAGVPTGDFFEGRPCRAGGIWKDIEKAARDAVVTGGPCFAGRCRWTFDRGDLLCQLPSGRRMTYRAARVERVPTRWGTSKDAVTYARGRTRVSTYGGKLTENVVQALCRDVLAAALVRLERAGLPVVLHVHDEVVCELDAEAELNDVIAICEAPLRWADGLPISASGYAGTRYRK